MKIAPDDYGEQTVLGTWRYVIPKRYRNNVAKTYTIGMILFLLAVGIMLLTVILIFR